MKITAENNQLVIKIPLEQDKYDYFGEKDGTCDNIIGIICGDEIGFAYQIDMSYKDKAPQWTEIFLKYWESEAEFKKLCKKLNLDIYEYPLCSKCHKPIFGACTWKDGGVVCFECE